MLFARGRALGACLLLLIGCALSACAHAVEPFNPDGELTLARALDAALRGNPDLHASAFELNAAQARIVQAQLRPNPEVALELENFAGSGELEGARRLETTLSLSQVIELGGKRSERRFLAEANIDTVGVEQRAREIDVLADVTRQFIDVVAAQERVRIAIEAAALSEQTLEAIATRVAAGRSPEAERSRARIALTRARVEQRQAESELRGARYALSASWGSPEPAFRTARAELLDLRAVDSFQSLMARLEQAPALLRFASESRLRASELRLARAQARPNLTFSLGARRFEDSDDAVLVAGVSMPLPLYDRNQGAIGEARSRLQQADALRDAAHVKARASLLRVYQEMEACKARVEMLRSEGLPQARLALEQTRSGYERGRFSFLELADAQAELLALRTATVDAAADYHRLRAEIERLTGTSLIEPTP